MKLTAVLTVSAISVITVSCSLMSRWSSPTAIAPDDVAGLVEAGIEAYNNGDITAAKSHLEAALRSPRAKSLKTTRARVQFYLAAVAWDVGDVKKTDVHLHRCLSLQPRFEPNWTFFAPGLRKRYEEAKLKVRIKR